MTVRVVDLWAVGLALGQASLAVGAHAGPALDVGFECLQDAVEGQAGVWAFGSSRCRVQNACAAATRVTW